MRPAVTALVALWALLAAPVSSALAWSDTGHQVVALIAWDQLREATRQKVVTLMARSTNAQLSSLFSRDGRPLAVRQREFFVRASTWADLIRGTEDDRPTWHHRSFFWKQVGSRAVEDWARESLAAAKSAYPPTLQRNQAAPDGYLTANTPIARERVALAGYRLAATLEGLLGR